MKLTITILVTAFVGAALALGACFLTALFWSALLDPPAYQVATFVTGVPIIGTGAVMFASWVSERIRD